LLRRNQLLPNGIIISGTGSVPRYYDADRLNKKDIIAGFAVSYWKNNYLRDSVFAHEIFSSSSPASLRALSEAVNRFNESLNFNASHAVVVTYNKIAVFGHYQLNIVSDVMNTFVVMNFAAIPEYGFHGVSNPECQYNQLQYVDERNSKRIFLARSNNGVAGQYVYPITDRLCLGKARLFILTRNLYRHNHVHFIYKKQY